MSGAAVQRSTPVSRRLGGGRISAWFANPWARPRFLWVIALAYVAWTLLPVAIAVLFSFNAGRALTAWQGFSTHWYVSGENSVWHDPELHSALFQSLKLSALTVLIAVPLGVAFALGLDR
jgi:spermidine/putrescine transport system permease protein